MEQPGAVVTVVVVDVMVVVVVILVVAGAVQHVDASRSPPCSEWHPSAVSQQ